MNSIRKYGGKIILTLIIVAGAAIFVALDIRQVLTLEYLQNSKEQFSAYYQENPILILSTYFAIYVIATAFSFPGATILTLAGGALFGFWRGFIVISFASTIGATSAMLISRTLLRDYVQGKFKKQIHVINQGVEKDGAYYLFTLRLVPVVPFFAINLGMGLMPIRVRTFYWVSQVGMIPGTAIYVNAGSELGKISALGDILSPGLMASLALLGIMPLVFKKLLNQIESRRHRSSGL